MVLLSSGHTFTAVNIYQNHWHLIVANIGEFHLSTLIDDFLWTKVENADLFCKYLL